MQIVLKEKGFYRGEPDGVFGPQTRQALIVFQAAAGLAGERADRQSDRDGPRHLDPEQGGAQPSTSGQGSGAGAQGAQPSQSGGQPSASEQGGEQNAAVAGCAGCRCRTARQPEREPASTTGQGNPPATSDKGAGAGQQGSQSQPSTSGQGNPPAAGGQGGDRKEIAPATLKP